MRNLMSWLMFALVSLAAFPAGATSPVVVSSAAHDGVWTKDGVQWRSRFDPEHLPSNGKAWRLELATPLAPDASVRADVSSTHVTSIRNERGEIVALDLSSEVAMVSTTLVTSLPPHGALDPPLARDAVQRVDVVGVAVKPAPDSPLELRLADVRHVELDAADRRRLQKRWGWPRSTRPIVLVADEAFVAAGGLTPALQTEDRSQVLVVLGGALGLLVVVLVIGIRFVSRRVQHEEADAFLRKHEPSLADL